QDLFVAQRFDRIEARGAIRWIKAESNSDDRANHQSRDRPSIRKNQIHFQPDRQQVPDDYSKNDSEDPASFRYENILGQKLSHDVFAAGADRFTNSDFFGSLG